MVRACNLMREVWASYSAPLINLSPPEETQSQLLNRALSQTQNGLVFPFSIPSNSIAAVEMPAHILMRTKMGAKQKENCSCF